MLRDFHCEYQESSILLAQRGEIGQLLYLHFLTRTEGQFLSQNPFRRIAQAIFGASVYLLSCNEDTD